MVLRVCIVDAQQIEERMREVMQGLTSVACQCLDDHVKDPINTHAHFAGSPDGSVTVSADVTQLHFSSSGKIYPFHAPLQQWRDFRDSWIHLSEIATKAEAETKAKARARPEKMVKAKCSVKCKSQNKGGRVVIEKE